MNCPLEAIGSEMNGTNLEEPFRVEVSAMCSDEGFPFLAFKAILRLVQRNALIRIRLVASLEQSSDKKASFHDENERDQKIPFFL